MKNTNKNVIKGGDMERSVIKKAIIIFGEAQDCRYNNAKQKEPDFSRAERFPLFIQFLFSFERKQKIVE